MKSRASCTAGKIASCLKNRESELGMVIHVYNPTGVEAGGLGFKVSLFYVGFKASLNKTNGRKHKSNWPVNCPGLVRNGVRAYLSLSRPGYL